MIADVYSLGKKSDIQEVIFFHGEREREREREGTITKRLEARIDITFWKQTLGSSITYQMSPLDFRGVFFGCLVVMWESQNPYLFFEWVKHTFLSLFIEQKRDFASKLGDGFDLASHS